MAYASGADGADRNSTSKLFIPTKLIDNYNITIDGRNMFESPIKAEDRRGYENLRDVMIGNGDDYTVGSLMDYDYFANTYKIIAVDLSRQKVLDADPRAIQQINLKGSIDDNYRVIFIVEESKDTILNFTQGTVKVV